MKLSNLLAQYNVVSSGFPAIAGIGARSTGDKPAVLSSNPAAALFAQGVTHYWTLVIPRGVQFNTTDDIIAADPDVELWEISPVDTTDMNTVITTQHAATRDRLQVLFPNATVIEQEIVDGRPRNITADEVAGKHVVGVLPPFLVAAAGAFTSASIKGFNAAVDGDLSAEEIKDRLVVATQAITVKKA